jgi:hypothetical protein
VWLKTERRRGGGEGADGRKRRKELLFRFEILFYLQSVAVHAANCVSLDECRLLG